MLPVQSVLLPHMHVYVSDYVCILMFGQRTDAAAIALLAIFVASS